MQGAWESTAAVLILFARTITEPARWNQHNKVFVKFDITYVYMNFVEIKLSKFLFVGGQGNFSTLSWIQNNVSHWMN